MKFCHNNSKKKCCQGLSPAGIRHLGTAWNRGIDRALAWSLPLVCLLSIAPTAQAQVATSLDWGTGAGGEAVDFAPGTTTNTYTNVGGSGVDVQVTVVGAITASPNANLILQDSDFVAPTPPNETLLVPISGEVGSQANISIQFFGNRYYHTGCSQPGLFPYT